MGRAPGPRGSSQGSLENHGGGSQEGPMWQKVKYRPGMGGGKGNVSLSGLGEVRGKPLLPASPSPSPSPSHSPCAHCSQRVPASQCTEGQGSDGCLAPRPLLPRPRGLL